MTLPPTSPIPLSPSASTTTNATATLSTTLSVSACALDLSLALNRFNSLLRSSTPNSLEKNLYEKLLSEAQETCASLLSMKQKVAKKNMNSEIDRQLPRNNVWSGFYKKTLQERRELVAMMYPAVKVLIDDKRKETSATQPNKSCTPPRPRGRSSDEVDSVLSEPIGDPLPGLGELSISTADVMIENCIGVVGMPLGVGLNFVVNGKGYVVPMAMEEPSVIAACSGAAKLIASVGGFSATYSGNVMTAEVQVLFSENTKRDEIIEAQNAIEREEQRLRDTANSFCPRMVARGGGVRRVYSRIVKTKAGLYNSQTSKEITMLVVMLDIDVCEAMGANKCNTVAEGIASDIEDVTGGRVGLRILTNLSLQRRACAEFRIPVSKLGWKKVNGTEVAKRVLEAYQFAAADPFRAATHNKGIMNGIDAVCVATGQDWRAIESGAHAYACYANGGKYSPLSTYRVETNDKGEIEALVAWLDIPMAIGTKGGSLQTHPAYRHTHAILGNPNCAELGMIIAAVGLAQNFAALRALAIEGINKGHMALHARNIATAAGAPPQLAREVGEYMRSKGTISVEVAQEYLRMHQLNGALSNATAAANAAARVANTKAAPSTLYVSLELPHLGLDEPISINTVFETFGKETVALRIKNNENESKQNVESKTSSKPLDHTLQCKLLGDKGFAQLERMFLVLDEIQLPTKQPPGMAKREVRRLQSTLKLTSILLNIVSFNLLGSREDAKQSSPSKFVCDVTMSFIRKALQLRKMGGGSLADLQCTKLAEDINLDLHAASPLLVVGLPLLLSLWKVFEANVQSFVSHRPLAEALVREQASIMELLVSTWCLAPGYGHILSPALRPTNISQNTLKEMPAVSIGRAENVNTVDRSVADNAAKMARWMPRLCKRWQATLCLLVDSLVVNPPVMTIERVNFVQRIGSFIEFEGTMAHDIARWQRDLAANKPNVVLLWHRLHCSGGEQLLEEAAVAAQSSMPNEVAAASREIAVSNSLDSFKLAMERYRKVMRDEIFSFEGKSNAAIFDLKKAVDEVPAVIRSLYSSI
eukprot:g6360.t1